jgi:hypothetical protein
MPWWVWFLVGYIVATMVNLLLLGFMGTVKHSDRKLK